LADRVPEECHSGSNNRACERWRESRVDVSEGTRVLHRVALGRVVPLLGQRPVDEISIDDINAMVAELASTGRKRETIKKSIKYLAAVLDEQGLDENPARSKRIRLPHEEHVEIEPPTSEHVEAVYRLLARSCRVPLLWLDWSGGSRRVGRNNPSGRLRRAGAAYPPACIDDEDAHRSMG
jgi:hypothetical protein